MGLQGYTPDDLARLKSIQTNNGYTAPRRREPIVGGRRVRLIGQVTETGALVITREYRGKRHDQQRDVTVQVPALRAAGRGGRQ
ncbi:hypothetical protein ACIBG7_18580 [Nonomuraea sp. NPDC050328]|uniref:hypothetical protein n=1 Tax=Nonomuraea sp. NPDC050328 TaxID=3364361 RepID=UPI0037908C9A